MTDRLWEIGDIVALVEAAEPKPGRRAVQKEGSLGVEILKWLFAFILFGMLPAIVAVRAPSPYWQIAIGVMFVVAVVFVVIGVRMGRKRQGRP